MISLKFDNENAQAWFRSCLRREAAKFGNEWMSLYVRDIVEECENDEALLFFDEARIALRACEDKVGDDPGLAPARQRIVDQLKRGLKET